MYYWYVGVVVFFFKGEEQKGDCVGVCSRSALAFRHTPYQLVCLYVSLYHNG